MSSPNVVEKVTSLWRKAVAMTMIIAGFFLIFSSSTSKDSHGSKAITLGGSVAYADATGCSGGSGSSGASGGCGCSSGD